MSKKLLINLIALIIGGVLGPSALISAQSAQPPIDWSDILFFLGGSVIGAIFVIGIQIFRKNPKYCRWALGFFTVASMFMLGSGIWAIIAGIIHVDFDPSTFFFISIGVGVLIGVLLSGVVYRLKFKEKL